jgi:prepilin-type N-terminal cleavage/methylation domain-containing protein
MTTHRQQHAFTLLEIMLAVTILALVGTAVYATWSAGLKGWKRSASITESLQRERVVMEMLAELTQSAVYFNSANSLYEFRGTHEEQTGDSISFVTGSDLLLPATEAVAAGMRRVTISLERDTRGNPFLGIANAPALQLDDAPEAPTHFLSANVCGFRVRYRDPRSSSWVEKWEEANLMPSAIEYTVAFGANDGRTPPVVVTRAVDLPVAAYALQALGQALSQNNTTNTVTTQEIDLAKPGSGGDSQ